MKDVLTTYIIKIVSVFFLILVIRDGGLDGTIIILCGYVIALDM